MSEALHTKYRPKKFEQVVGQAGTIKALRSIVDRKESQAFLFSGPAGTGKTTLARIVASEIGCDAKNILEIDAATYNGIEQMRQIQEVVQYKPMGEASARAVILDECFHRDTLIDTPNGPVPIYKLKSGDKVLGAYGVQTVEYSIKKYVPLTHVIKLCLDDTTIFCSKEHPFLTTEGWCAAEDLNGKKIASISGSELSMFLCEMWDEVFESRIRFEILRRLSLYIQNVCSLRSKVSRNSLSAFNPYFLFSEMWEYVSGCEENWNKAFVGAKGEIFSKYALEPFQEEGYVGSNFPSPFRANETKQPNALSAYSGQDGPYKGEKWNFAKLDREERGKWKGFDQASENVVESLRGWGAGICDTHKTNSWKRLSNLLQSGYWVSEAKNSYRNRWTNASAKIAIPLGYKENETTKQVRVESLSIYERRNLRELTESGKRGQEVSEFYDLKIKEHPSFSVSGLITHNCHMLSKAAWNSLLKIVEEPPKHAYFFFCTTESGKVINTIKTRCSAFTLSLLSEPDLGKIVDRVCKKEGIELDGGVRQVIVTEALGSGRQALVNLSMCRDAKDRKEAATILKSAIGSEPVLELCRALSKGNLSFQKAMTLVSKIEGDAESARIQIVNYFASCAMNAKSDKEASAFCAVLESFREPYNATDKKAGLILSIGGILL